MNSVDRVVGEGEVGALRETILLGGIEIVVGGAL
jgi:hypothetical protein